MTTTVLERFLRYVRFDTQSDARSATVPSTEKQLVLARALAIELLAMGVLDAEVDAQGYLYATIRSTTARPAPVICLCAHLDTAPDCSGTGVKPLVHWAWNGSDIALPDAPGVVLRPSEIPYLATQVGQDIVTASGTTLLGADDKAGVAIVMALAAYLMAHPEIEHGPIRILFTPDEEIGRGADHVDLVKLGADYAYTLDGSELGSLEAENFSADAATLTIEGVPAHPGAAKGVLESAIRFAAGVVAALPLGQHSPEATEGREGFIHLTGMEGNIAHAKAEFILRAFEDAELRRMEGLLHAALAAVAPGFPNCRWEVAVREQYRNMRPVLDAHPEVVENALLAIKRAGLAPVLGSIRGGTDGARLSHMGLPCPNLFTGESSLHSVYEWVSVRDMEKSVEVLVHLLQIWAGVPEADLWVPGA